MRFPIHLLTREAMQLYVSRLAPGGVIALHISNLHLSLSPVLARVAQEEGLTVLWQREPATAGSLTVGKFPSEWMVVARGPRRPRQPSGRRTLASRRMSRRRRRSGPTTSRTSSRCSATSLYSRGSALELPYTRSRAPVARARSHLGTSVWFMRQLLESRSISYGPNARTRAAYCTTVTGGLVAARV